VKTVHIWIDADSCPRMVRDYILGYAEKIALPVLFVANHIIPAEKGKKHEMIVCDKTQDAADDYILSHADSCDMIITRDIPLAARCVENQLCVLNDRGALYTKENIGQRLSERNFSLQLAQIGLGGNKSYSYGKKEFSAFTRCFDKEIHHLIKNTLVLNDSQQTCF
jgi:uncharacterized protein